VFGYVTIDPGTLQKTALERYQGIYCGLCRTLKQRYGNKGRITLSNDMTFLAVLLNSLYEPYETVSGGNCVFHPAKKQTFIQTEFSEYAADMNIVLAYHKCMDNWADDQSFAGLAQAKLLQGAYQKTKALYPEKCETIAQTLTHIGELEKENIAGVDCLANLTAHMLGEIYAVRNDYWAGALRVIGGAIGRFVYLMDAYEDLPADIRKKRFNPLIGMKEEDQYELTLKDSLSMLISECTGAFEILPLEKDVDILRNILYSGIWTRYEQIQQKNKRNIKDKLKETETNA
jgi:hypothetical protein